jgi:hypothetical protein
LFRNPLEHSLGRSNFLAKLIQHRIGDCSHVIFSKTGFKVSEVSQFQGFKS